MIIKIVNQVSDTDTSIINYCDNNRSNIGYDTNQILINTQSYLDNILTSYKKSESAIQHQINVDLPRTCVYFNNIRMTTIDDIDNYMYYLRDFAYNGINFISIIKMLCTQASYAFPYIFISKLYCEDEGLLLCSNNTDRKINIYFDNYYKNLEIKIDGEFCIKKLATTENVSQIKFSLIISTNIIKTTYYLDYFTYYNLADSVFYPSIMMSWQNY